MHRIKHDTRIGVISTCSALISVMAYSGSFRNSLPLPGWYLMQESSQMQLHYSPSPCQQSPALQPREARLEVPGVAHFSSSCASTPSNTPPSVAQRLPHFASRSRLVHVQPSPCQLLESDSYSDVGTPRAFINLTNRQRRRRPHVASRYIQHSPAEGEQRASKRKAFWAIYQELVDTEESYLDSLHTVLDVFMSPMEHSNAIPHRDFRLLFPAQLEQLIEIHSNLLRDMRTALHSGEDEIGRIFLQLLGSRQVGFASVYGAYMNGFQTSCQMLRKYLLDSYFRTVYEACLQDPRCKGLDLLAYLLTPIQRLPRYRLLLKELLRRLSCATFTPLEQAVRLLEADLGKLDSAILQATHCHIMQGYRQLRRNRKAFVSMRRRPKKNVRWSGASWSSSSSVSPLSTTASQPKLGDAASTTSHYSSVSPVQPALLSQQQLCMSTPQLHTRESYMDHVTTATPPVRGGSAHSMRFMSLLDLQSATSKQDSASKQDKKGLGKLIKKLFHKKQ